MNGLLASSHTSAFLAHPENFFWGRIMLTVLFSLAIGIPLVIAAFQERRMRRDRSE